MEGIEKMTLGNIIKTEKIGYLKSKLDLQQGRLDMTENRIALEAHKTGVGGLGLLGALIKQRVEKPREIFNLAFGEIQSVQQGKHGFQKNVLEITDNKNHVFRIIVKDYLDWEKAIKARK